ncbi:hypothetical protein BV510_26200 [Mycolicibacterium diernhoferi]|uniref:Uncharacterized protein n=1 Tax=Mycolicibacterium diernhoferi TaxID=1801 RepID=A0A1T3VWX4_9MYCO|nr:hypothetical protein BV510_26200 [Mycolicibacterium diernhoferi]
MQGARGQPGATRSGRGAAEQDDLAVRYGGQDRAHRINAEHTRNATELALASAAKDHNQDRITNGATAPPDIFDSQTTNAADPDPPPF